MGNLFKDAVNVGAAFLTGGATLPISAQYYGQSSANEQSKKEAKRNREFQERMSNTAHQRAVSDLKKAGLNPILATTPAGTPGGNMAQIKSATETASTTALGTKRLNQELKNLQAQEEKTRADTKAVNQSIGIKTPWEQFMDDIGEGYLKGKDAVNSAKDQWNDADSKMKGLENKFKEWLKKQHSKAKKHRSNKKEPAVIDWRKDYPY